MKKICLAFVLILAMAVLVPVAAQAATDQETKICALVKEKDKIVDAQCVVYERNCVIAIKTEKFTSKTNYDEFRTKLEREIAEKFDLDKVLITRSPKVMHTITQLEKMSDAEREATIQKFLDKLFHRDQQPGIKPRITL